MHLMKNFIVGIVPPGKLDSLTDRMDIWLTESGLDAELETLTVESAEGLSEGFETCLNVTEGKVLGVLVDINLIPNESVSALKAITSDRKIALYQLHK